MTDQPLPLHPNAIDAMYWDMANKGQFYWPQLGGPPLTIHEWRERELKRWHDNGEEAKVTGERIEREK